jgi:hypothetical protein
MYFVVDPKNQEKLASKRKTRRCQHRFLMTMLIIYLNELITYFGKLVLKGIYGPTTVRVIADFFFKTAWIIQYSFYY